jgi:cell division protein ZapB
MENECLDENEPLFEADRFDDEMVETVETSLIILAERVDQLVQWCAQLARENRVLREQNGALESERDTLRQKYEQSRARVEAMIVRLKDLGQNL